MTASMHMQLLKKIYAGGETTIDDRYEHPCYGAVLKDWKEEMSFRELMISEAEGRETFYDKFYAYENFFDKAEALMDGFVEDAYFSINTFWRRNKETTDIRHLNAFALDFDFYKVKEFKMMDTEGFWKLIKDILPFQATAAVDSGRGLYVIYAFKHCSKERVGLYKSIYKAFYDRFRDYGMDGAATCVTQVIRIPGTVNSKSLTEVKVIELNETDYELTDFCTILKYSRSEVLQFKKEKKEPKEKNESNSNERKRWTKVLVEDFKRLIAIRNRKKEYDGYREQLIYLLRERLIWAACPIDEAVETALEVNSCFHFPLSRKEIETQCRPTMHKRCNSIKTVIRKLDIKLDEQEGMKILISKTLKDSLYSKRKRKHKLLNMTEKEIEQLKRRTRILAMKKEGYTNSQIADKMEIAKSTVTKDLDYISKNRWQFREKLAEAVNEFTELMELPEFLRRITYDMREKLMEWLKISPEALE